MAKAYTIQTAFNSGVLDTRLSARVDVKQYYQGMSVGDNVLCLPQGGVKRRPGMEYIADAGEECRVVPFVFNINQAYLLVFRNNAIDIYRDDVFKATVVSTYTTAQLMDLQFDQSADTLVIAHEDHAPALLQRLGSDVSWSLTDIAFSFIPQYDFNDALSPAPTSEIQTLTFNNFLEGDSFFLNLEGVDTDRLSWNASEANTASDIEEALNALVNTPPSGITVVSGGAGLFTVTFADSAAKDWRLIVGREPLTTTTTTPS
jgi:hypothetical protein